MTKNSPKQHGGRRPGAGRKPSLKPLAIIRLLDPAIRADLVAITLHQRLASSNPQLSQEQVVADLIRAAHRQLENNNNQNSTHKNAIEEAASDGGVAAIALQLETDAATLSTVRQEVSDILARLRKKSAVGQREGNRLLDLLTQLIALHAAQIGPWAILEELDRAHTDDADRDQAIAVLLQRPLAEYRQDGWTTALQHIAAQLATGPIRRKTEQWDFINLAVEISGSTLVTNDRIADLIERLQEQGINPTRWLELVDHNQSPTSPAPELRSTTVSPQILPVATLPPAPPAEITGVGLPRGKSHYLGAVGRTLCGHYLPTDLDDATWIRDPAFTPTCRRCRALFHPTFPIPVSS